MNKYSKALLAAASCIAASVVLQSTTGAQTLAALPASTAPASATGDAKAIAGWVDFCRRYAAECEVNTSEPSVIALTPKVWQTIVAVNKRVNTTIKPVTDADHWGVADRWDIPTDGMGDCEDFQLMKRKLLAAAGLPRRAMRMTVVIDEKNEGHAVLMVRTDRGDLVLDNKVNEVMPWFETGYVYVKRESQDRLGWTSLGGAISPTVTANR